jgi:two-component system response regulator YesN
MYKALIVDDEPVILDGLRRVLDWEEHGIEIAAQASTAAEALRVLATGGIHILVTDIRMPVMDGLELIRRAQQGEDPPRCVVLSGHDEFTYLQTAIKLGIENYLLKPVNRDELSETMQAITRKLGGPDRARAPVDRVFRANLLERWLTRSIGDAELRERANLAGVDLSRPSHVVALLRCRAGRACAPAERTGGARAALARLCEERCDVSRGLTTFLDSDGDVVLIAAVDHGTPTRAVLRELVRGLAGAARDRLGVPVFASLGGLEDTYRGAPASYVRAKELQGHSLVLPPEAIADSEDIGRAVRERRAKLDVDFSVFDQIVRAGREAECERFVESLLERMATTPGVTPKLVRDVALELVYHVTHAVRPPGLRGEMAMEPITDCSEILRLGTIDELAEWLRDMIRRALELDRQVDRGYSPLVRQVLREVHANRGKDLSIKVLAAQLNKNAAYLGQLFKQETGQLLSVYLAGVRIEEAKQLLRETNLKMAEISHTVGYPNLNYFYRVFKKSTGVSPTDFRNER